MWRPKSGSMFATKGSQTPTRARDNGRMTNWGCNRTGTPGGSGKPIEAWGKVLHDPGLAEVIPKVYRSLFNYEVEEIEVERDGQGRVLIRSTELQRCRCEIDLTTRSQVRAERTCAVTGR